MPIRAAALPPGDSASCRKQLGLCEDAPVLVITGASQGATTINTLLPELFREHPGLRGPWQILHLSGPSNAASVRAAWAENDQGVTVIEFRHDMGAIWGAADLVVSRAGACSVAEIEYAGIPAVYLPYPHHRDQHQRRNAEPAVEAGAALSVIDGPDLTVTRKQLRSTLGPLLEDPQALSRIKAAAQARSGSNAAEAVAAMILSLA
jgi:UDP-N-acetylglucosamine--N-acetylmuramyl-(pentapeptide) pyrophosphoryl-undecaprenol N-acetylglucosamine transferase